jgi:hypothetical protein
VIRKYTLRYDNSQDKWILRHDVSEKIVKVFATKEGATRAGVLRKTIGRQGGFVRVLTRNGAFEEERTFPEVRTAENPRTNRAKR